MIGCWCAEGLAAARSDLEANMLAQDIKRTFPAALDLGCGAGSIVRNLSSHGGIKSLLQLESSPEMASRAEAAAASARQSLPERAWVRGNTLGGSPNQPPPLGGHSLC